MAQNLRLDIDQVAEIFYIVLESFASYSLEAEYLTNGPRREEENRNTSKEKADEATSEMPQASSAVNSPIEHNELL